MVVGTTVVVLELVDVDVDVVVLVDVDVVVLVVVVEVEVEVVGVEVVAGGLVAGLGGSVLVVTSWVGSPAVLLLMAVVGAVSAGALLSSPTATPMPASARVAAPP